MQSFQRFLWATFVVLMLATSMHVRAAVFCVQTSHDLTSALLQAASNGQNNTIKIVAGTITGSFGYSTADSFNLDIEGGWSIIDCAIQRRDAALTILDGTSVNANYALVLNTSGSGNITLRYLTFQHYFTFAPTLALYTGGSGDLRLENSLFIHNSPISNANPIIDMVNFGGSGSVYFLDNAVIANLSNGPIVYLQGGGSASATCNLCANNNTVSGNTLAYGYYSAVEVASLNAANTNLANNIFWGNSGQGPDLYIVGSAILVDNDVGTEGGTTPAAGSSGNISVDPLFANAAAGDYRLRATSPARDVGDNTPPGTIRNYDLDGTARIDGAIVDMGAYEFHNVIFANDFEVTP